MPTKHTKATKKKIKSFSFFRAFRVFRGQYLTFWVVAQEREKSYTLFMVKLKCYHCQSENLVRNGKTNNGKQRYLCNDCGRMSRDNPQSNSYSAEEREKILRAYEERSSLRGLTRTFGVARNTVSGWLREKNS